MRTIGLRLAMLSACLLVDGGVACGGGPPRKPHTLSSGRTIKILSIAPLTAKFGQALVLSYQTDLKVDQAADLQKEASEIWVDFRHDADKAKVDAAIIMANEVPAGVIISHNKSFNFVFERSKDAGWAQVGSKVARATVSRSGTYDVSGPIVEAAPDATSDKTRRSRGVPKWIASPDTIVPKKGTHFGCEFAVEGEPAGAVLDVQIVIAHPPFRQPGSSEPSTRASWTQPVVLGSPSFAGYSFDEDWETAPGTWTVRVYRGSDLLTEKDFAVAQPRASGK